MVLSDERDRVRVCLTLFHRGNSFFILVFWTPFVPGG